MALTQKRVREIIETTENHLKETVKEKEEFTEQLRKTFLSDEELEEKAYEVQGYNDSIHFYTGQITAYKDILNEMKSK